MSLFKYPIGVAPSTTQPYLRALVKSYFSERVSYMLWSDHWADISMHYNVGGVVVEAHSYATVPLTLPVTLKYICGFSAVATNVGFSIQYNTDAENKLNLRIYNISNEQRQSNNVRLLVTGVY